MKRLRFAPRFQEAFALKCASCFHQHQIIHSNNDFEVPGKTNATFVPEPLYGVLSSSNMLCVKSGNISGNNVAIFLAENLESCKRRLVPNSLSLLRARTQTGS